MNALLTEDLPEPETRPRSRVLIVDDDERNLLALQMVVEDVAEVVTASSGEEALRHLLKYDFAAILLDVFMPILDGYETARLIRQRETSKGIPIIFLSAVNKEDEHLRRGYAMGAVDYVFKPVEPLILRSKIAVFVELHEKTREIQRGALQERRLREENARIHRENLLAEQALRRAEQRQALVLGSLPIVLYLEPVDASPRVPHYVSGDLKAMTGYDFEAVRANPTIWADRLHPDDRARVIAARAALPASDRLSIEYRWQAADGSYRHLLEQAVVLRDAGDRPTEVAGTLLDVTGQRQLEGQLAQAQKMDAVGKLTGGIAHDFNNLLAAVLGGLGLIERRMTLDAEQQKLIDMTRRSAEQGAELVKRLLAFARRQDLQANAVPWARLVGSLKGLLEHTLGGLVQVEWSVPDDIWNVLADENQLELALMNLILNARDAMPEGGVVTIAVQNRTIASEGVLAPGDYVAICVGDTGMGIPPEAIEHVFEPFFTTKEVGKGTGLGLSMVYGFAEQSGGTIRARSEPGMGTTFEFLLPRAHAPETSGKAARPEASADVSPARILLVDDHAAVRGMTAAMLVELGHEVTPTSNARNALDRLGETPAGFDLIIADYAMPGISGVELIRQARKIRGGIPALIVTGYADTAMIDARPSDVAVLTKPFTPETLSKAIASGLVPSEACA